SRERTSFFNGIFLLFVIFVSLCPLCSIPESPSAPRPFTHYALRITNMLTPLLMLLYQSQAHAGELEGATHRGVAGEPGCGPYLVIRMRVKNGIIREARFLTYGCPVMMACGELVCLRSEGEPLEAIRA